MQQTMRAQGYQGSLVTFGFYSNDLRCDVIISRNGSIRTSVHELAKDLAWQFYNRYSAQNTPISVVAHSLGGLLTRYALYRVAMGDVSYPPFLMVSHVSTLGTPYQGYNLIAEICYLNPINAQCREMSPRSSFIAEFKNPGALLPQGKGGTIWTNVGSNADPFDRSDGFVKSTSATSMQISQPRKKTMPWYRLIFHTMYTRNPTVIQFVIDSLANGNGAAKRSLASSERAIKDTVQFAQASGLLEKDSSATDVTVSLAQATEDMDTLPENASPAKISPYRVKGEQAGVQLESVLAGGLFDQMGLKNGDVIQGCNSETLNSPFEGLATLDAHHTSGKIKLCIQRGHEHTTQVVAFQ